MHWHDPAHLIHALPQLQLEPRAKHLVAVLLELLLRLLGHLGILLRIRQLLAGSFLALVVGLALDLSPLLEPAGATSVCCSNVTHMCI